MLQSKYLSPLSGKKFETHGVKEIGNYIYVLLIDMVGQTLIKRVKSDNTEILFTLKAEGTSISDFWTNPDTLEYTYLYAV